MPVAGLHLEQASRHLFDDEEHTWPGRRQLGIDPDLVKHQDGGLGEWLELVPHLLGTHRGQTLLVRHLVAISRKYPQNFHHGVFEMFGSQFDGHGARFLHALLVASIRFS